MKAKRIISSLMSAIMVLTCVFALTLVVNTVEPMKASATGETATKKAFYIGKSESGKQNTINVFFPFNVKDYDSATGQHYVKIHFKVKMLSGTKPYVGRFTGANTSPGGTRQEYPWDNSGTTYNSSTGEFSTGYLGVWSGSDYQTYNKGQADEKCEGITIGNVERKDGKTYQGDFDNEFIFTDVAVELYDSSKNLINSNIAPAVSEDDFTDGAYQMRSNEDKKYRNLMDAPKNKWSIDTSYSKVKLIDVPADFFTGATPSFTQHNATSVTREYYTSPNYSDLYFAKLGGTYQIINDINKKIVEIKANMPGEDRTANIGIPLYLDQWWVQATDPNPTSKKCYVKVTADVERLSGSGKPMLTRLYGDTKTYRTNGSTACSYNNTVGESGLPQTTYNASTGQFVGWVRHWRGSDGQLLPNGANEVLLFGNVEVAAESTDNAYQSSFAIKDIQIDVYDSDMSTLIKADAGPDFYAENINDTYGYIASNQTAKSDDRSHSIGRASGSKWSVCGDPYMITAYNLTNCYLSGHTFTYNAETATTVEHYHCSCGRNYVDRFGNEELSDISATQKMIVINSTGQTGANAFIPVNFQDWDLENEQYYVFKCKMRMFGDELPSISVMRPNYYSDYSAAYSEDGFTGYGETGNTLFSRYDPATGTYTAVIKLFLGGFRDYYAYWLREPNTYAHHAILLGNSKHKGTGRGETSYESGFAFTDPELYKLTNANDPTSVEGADLCTNITDKSLNFGTTYKYSNLNSSNEDTSANNIMAAPANKWSIDGSTNYVHAYDIPDGYFEGTEDSKVIRLAGAANANVGNALNSQIFLESDTTYQFDLDYRVFGGSALNLVTRDHNGTSWASVSRTDLTDDGSHISFRFTTRSLRTSGDGNFSAQIGVGTEERYVTSSLYFTNMSVRKVTGDTLGPNHYINGNLSLSPAQVLTGLSDDNIKAGLPLWTNGAAWNNDLLGVKNFTQAYVMPMPESELFAGSEVTGLENIALKAIGSKQAQIQFKVGLQPDKYYRLEYNYRSTGDEPEISAASNTGGSVTVTKQNVVPRHGKVSAQYEVYSNAANEPAYTNTWRNPNTRFIFSFGADSTGNDFYINGVTLYELDGSGGNTVGSNLVGDLNPILNDGVYDIVPNVKDTYGLYLNQDGTSSISRYVASGWFGYNQDGANSAGDYTNVNGYIVRVPADFFNSIDVAQRVGLIRKVILGTETSDGINPYYNPNNDSVWGDVRDLVHAKNKAVINGGSGNSLSGAKSTADFRLNNVIMTNKNGEWSGGGKSYYVSNSGSDSNSGTSAANALATISKANSKAVSGDTIYLERGSTWRNSTDNAEISFELKSGVHYSAYGSGAKPEILGSRKNYGGSSNASGWTSAGTNLWRYRYSTDVHTYNCAGMIYFIDSSGNVTLGKDVATPATENTYSWNLSDVDSDLEYYAPYRGAANAGYIYVYSATNPANRFPRIEIAIGRPVISASGGSSNETRYTTTLDHIAVKYGGEHGIVASGSGNLSIKHCEIAYIGGVNNNNNRLGNGVQFGNGFDNGRVSDCYIHDCYDAGVTFQSFGSGSPVTFSNISFTGNVIENCAYNVEIFLGRNPTSDIMRNIYIRDNILRNAGYGWGCYDRCDGGYRMANIAFSKNSYMDHVEELYIENNIFDCTRFSHIMWTWDTTGPLMHAGVTVRDNTYFQRKGAYDGAVMAYGPIAGGFKYASSRESLLAAVNTVDSSPAAVYWIENS